MSKGWIKLYRKFIDWEWYDDNNVKVVFLHCLLRANFKPQKYRGKVVERGQFITGRRKFAEEVHLSVQQVRTAWDKLQSTGEITINTTNKGTTVTVCNYGSYQVYKNQYNQQDNQQITNEQPASNQQVTTIKKDKKVKKDKKYSTPALKEVKEYFQEKGYSASLAEKFFSYYQEPMEDRNGRVWKDQQGNTVKSWKQKAIAVWFKNANKVKYEPQPTQRYA